MASHQSAAEVKAHYIATMGSDAGRMFYRLLGEFMALKARWADFVELFGKNKARVDLLNQAAPAFFHTVQEDLFDATLLHLSRITDPVASRVGGESKLNLSLAALVVACGPDTQARLRPLLSKTRNKVSFARGVRNRRIAHRELDSSKPLPPATRRKVVAAIDAVRDLLCAVSSCQGGEGIWLEDSGARSGGGFSVLACIDDGLIRRKDRHLRLADGRATRTDLDLSGRRPWW